MLWSSNGALANNSPTHSSERFRANTLNQNNVFMNTTPSAFTNTQVLGVYGVTNTQVKAAESNAQHKTLNLQPGWWVVKQGMGAAVSATITASGSGYSNNDKFVVTSTGTGTVNVSTTVATNATGGVVSVGSNNVINAGLFINSTATTASITNTTGGTANGSGFTATVALGGRANRIQRECLVSLGSMTSNTNSANNPLFPNI
jgi:hypothetical protein